MKPKSKPAFFLALLAASIVLAGCTAPGYTGSDNSPGAGDSTPGLSAPTFSDSELAEFGDVLDDSQGDLDALNQTEGTPEQFS